MNKVYEHRCFPVNIAIFKNSFIYKTPLVEKLGDKSYPEFSTLIFLSFLFNIYQSSNMVKKPLSFRSSFKVFIKPLRHHEEVRK